MKITEGLTIREGVAYGKAFFYKKSIFSEEKREYSVDMELVAFNGAKLNIVNNLERLIIKSERNLGKKEADIFRSEIEMVNDFMVNSLIISEIRKGLDSITAIHNIYAGYYEKLINSDDKVFFDRAEDIKNVEALWVNEFKGKQRLPKIPEDSVIVCDSLSPSELLEFPLENINGFVFFKGSPYSHISILIKSLQKPFVIIKDSTASAAAFHNRDILVDGNRGRVIFEPDTEMLINYPETEKDEASDSISENIDECNFYCNISQHDSIEKIIHSDAAGIGLFRTEYIYMNRNVPPDIDELLMLFVPYVNGMKGKPVIIRMPDFGGDKCPSYIHFEKEDNPALGVRGIRYYYRDDELTDTMLTALYLAKEYGDVRILFPMITNLEDVRWIKEKTACIREKLERKGHSGLNPRLGIMIETPGAALISDILAKEVDFFCVGTNDLIQYTLAADRLNDGVYEYYDPFHPAIKRLLETVYKSAACNGIDVEICGEIAGERRALKYLTELGYRDFSVDAALIKSLKNK